MLACVFLLLPRNEWVRLGSEEEKGRSGPEIEITRLWQTVNGEGLNDLVTQTCKVSALHTYTHMLHAHGHCGFCLLFPAMHVSFLSHCCIYS